MRKIITLFSFIVASLVAQATHIRCGHISLIRMDGLTYQIILNVYTNSGSEIKFGDGVLDFGDGTAPHITPTTENTLRPDLGPNIATVVYSINHTYPGPGNYVITYGENNLSGGIINITNSVETKFYLETQISLDANTDCSSPLFLVDPIFNQLFGQEYNFSTAAMDNNDYTLTYELVNPLEPGSPNFSIPENIRINNYNGLVMWDVKYNDTYQTGEYLFAVRVTQYNSEGKRVGYVVRSFQVATDGLAVVQPIPGPNSEINVNNPIEDINGKIVVESNQKRNIRVFLETVSEESIWQETLWVANFDKKINNNLSFSQYDSTSGVSKIRVGLLQLNSTSDIIRDNPYTITLRAKFKASGEVFSKDISYLFFTKDIQLPLITGVSESEQSEMLIYPNPFSNFLKLELNTINYPSEVDVLNNSGQIIIRTKVHNDEPLETSQLQPGLYILRIRNGRKVFSQKVIKK